MAEENDLDTPSNGHIILTIKGVAYDCRRPTSDEYIHLMETAIDVENKIEVFNKDQEMPSLDRIKKSLDLMGDFILDMLATLCPLPFEATKGDLPPWIIGGVIGRVTRHWITNPLDHPGN